MILYYNLVFYPDLLNVFWNSIIRCDYAIIYNEFWSRILKIVSISDHAFVAENIGCLTSCLNYLVWRSEVFWGWPIGIRRVLIGIPNLIISLLIIRVILWVGFKCVSRLICVLSLWIRLPHFKNVKFKREFWLSWLRLLKWAQFWKHANKKTEN